MKLKRLFMIAIFAALTAVLSQVAIPLPFTPIPVNLATFAVMMSGMLLGPAGGVSAMLVYMALGLAGVPVFAGMSAGFGRLLGPTGGYIIGYALCALICGFAARRTRPRTYHFGSAGVLGMVACYTLGTAWYMISTGTPLIAALGMCVVPFLAGDALKIVCAVLCSARLHRAMPHLDASRHTQSS